MGEPHREAFILLSGLHREDIGESVDLAAKRLAGAFDDEAKTVKAEFVIEQGRDEDYGKDAETRHQTRLASVSRRDSPGIAEPSAVLDVYGLDYRKALIGDREDRTPIRQLLSTFWVLASNARKLVVPRDRKSKTTAERNQVRLGWGVYCVLFAYFVILFVAAAGPLLPTEKPAPPRAAAEASEADGVKSEGGAQIVLAKLTAVSATYLAPAARMMQVFVVWITAVGLFLKIDLEGMIQKNGLGISVAGEYLGLGTGRPTLDEQFGALLNHIGEKDVEYQRVHVISYSFGSVIALDTLFAHDLPAAVFRRIDSLTTVGCPFDFIRAYWPSHFSARKQLDGVPAKWVNIYSAADVLGSDFKDVETLKLSGIPIVDKAERRPDVNELFGNPKKLDDYGRIEKLGFLGFRMHAQYWEGTAPGCYRNIVREVFVDTPFLA